MVYMNVLQFDDCSSYYVLVYWLSTYWVIYEMQYLYVTYRFGVTIRQLLFNSVSSGFPSVAAYATWHVSNARLLLWCALIALVSSALMLGDPIAMKMDIVERGTVVGCSFQPFDRDSAMLLHRDLEL